MITVYEAIYEEAVKAGKKALEDCKPTPVGFYPAGIFGERLGPTEIVNEGNCGGAYLILVDGRSQFVKWLKAKRPRLITKNIMGRGQELSCTDAHKEYHGQSAERYEACAEAMAEVLNKNGIETRVRAYLT